jgi:hypothetical protein
MTMTSRNTQSTDWRNPTSKLPPIGGTQVKWRDSDSDKKRLAQDLKSKLKKLNITDPKIINYYLKRRSNG